MSELIADLTSDTFDEAVTNAEGTVLVDFWAEWCGPCKMIAPILDEIAEEHGDNVTVVKVNVDDASDIAQRYQVMSIPTLIIFDKGEVAKKMVGASGKSKIIDELTPFM